MEQFPRISEAEWDVLGVLWQNAPLTATQVFAGLTGRSWKLNTVRTFLARLEKNGVIASAEGAKGKLYSPRLSRQTCVGQVSQTFLDRVFDGATGSLLVHFAKRERLNESELSELQSILAKKGKGK